MSSAYSSYYTLSELYDVQSFMRTFRHADDNPTLADYTQRSTVIDERGNEYNFQHSHNHDLRHGRPLPQDIRDCPRVGSVIDPHTGECADRCSSSHECALGYSCVNGNCIRERCQTNSDCSSKNCDTHSQLCQPLKCSSERRREFPTGMYVSEGVHSRFVPEQYQPDVCVSTSHYHLKGRDSIEDFSDDPRFRGMYSR